MGRTCTFAATTAVVGLLVTATTLMAQAPPSVPGGPVGVPGSAPTPVDEIRTRDEVPQPPITVPSQGPTSPPVGPPPPEWVPSQGIRSTAPPPPRVVPTQ